MPPAATAARRHVHDLARQHGVTLHWVHDWAQSEAFAGLREVRVPFIEGAGDYLVALHELGHVIAPGAQALEALGWDGPYVTLALEGMAWAWAVSVADTSLVEPEAWDTPLFALWTHFDAVLESRGVEFPEGSPEGFPQDPPDEDLPESDPLATD